MLCVQLGSKVKTSCARARSLAAHESMLTDRCVQCPLSITSHYPVTQFHWSPHPVNQPVPPIRLPPTSHALSPWFYGAGMESSSAAYGTFVSEVVRNWELDGG